MSFPLQLEGKQIIVHHSSYQQSWLNQVQEIFFVFTCASKVSPATRVTPLHERTCIAPSDIFRIPFAAQFYFKYIFDP